MRDSIQMKENLEMMMQSSGKSTYCNSSLKFCNVHKKQKSDIPLNSFKCSDFTCFVNIFWNKKSNIWLISALINDLFHCLLFFQTSTMTGIMSRSIPLIIQLNRSRYPENSLFKWSEKVYIYFFNTLIIFDIQNPILSLLLMLTKSESQPIFERFKWCYML